MALNLRINILTKDRFASYITFSKAIDKAFSRANRESYEACTLENMLFIKIGGIHMQSTSTRNVATKTRGSQRMLRAITLIILLLLATQFLIGMLVNLYVTTIPPHPGGSAPEYFSGVVQGVAWALVHAPLFLLLHAVVGLLLFFGALVILGLAIASRRRAWIISSIFGWLGIMLAGFNGASFMNYGEPFSSLFMSMGFLMAVIAYILGVYVMR
jgi:hypothetical protein